ncbi:hypothetical protein C8J55DRAFT_529939 [Lentinula edodes]|uniref:Transmembrane protein n=1 Tax=Lentinula lateritia TaxID=40482 RepID=A0A9W9DE09_9AGAR|nr:hypothetical protein C8J55DRAFT_529939 [Lentinula edodes]
MGPSDFVLPRLGTDMGAGAGGANTLGNMDLRGSLPFTPFTPSWTPDPYGGYPLQFVNPFTHTPPVPSNPCSPIGYSYPLAPLPTSAPIYDMYPPPQEFGPIDGPEPLYPCHLGTTEAAVDYKTYGAQTVQHDPGFAHNYNYSDQDLGPDLRAQTMDSDLSSGISLDFIKCETLLKQTRRSWLEDLLGAVLGYGLFSLGVMMLFLGLLYLYDADLQYKTLLVKETFHAELGCDYTLNSSNSKETMSFCHHNNTSVPDLHVYRTAAQPYLQIFTALVCYTVLILGVSSWRTFEKIVRCVNAGYTFLLRYLQIRKKEASRVRPYYSPTSSSCGCTNCSLSTAFRYKPSQCQCRHTCVDCYEALIKSFELLVRTDRWSDTLLCPSVFLRETLKPSSFKEWVHKVLWMIFALQIPFVLLLSIYRLVLLQGPSPGSYLNYVISVFVALACFISITRFTRRLIVPSVESVVNHYIEGTGIQSTDTRVTVPWVCAKMWKTMGADWEDMVETWEDYVGREQKCQETRERMIRKMGSERWFDVDQKNSLRLV